MWKWVVALVCLCLLSACDDATGSHDAMSTGTTTMTAHGGPVLRTPTEGDMYPMAGVAGRLHLSKGCLALRWHGRDSVPSWPPSTAWDTEEHSVVMTHDDYSVTYGVGSWIGEAGGGYYEDFTSDAPSLIGDQVWAQAVRCAHKIHAEQLVLIAPASP